MKITRMKQVTYKDNPTRLSANFSAANLQARRKWQEIFKVTKERKLRLRILYLARLSFIIEGEIKSFPEKQKLKKFTTTKLALQDS